MERSLKKLAYYTNIVMLKKLKIKYLQKFVIFFKFTRLSIFEINIKLKMIALDAEIEAHEAFIQIFTERIAEGEKVLKEIADEKNKKQNATMQIHK